MVGVCQGMEVIAEIIEGGVFRMRSEYIDTEVNVELGHFHHFGHFVSSQMKKQNLCCLWPWSGLYQEIQTDGKRGKYLFFRI